MKTFTALMALTSGTVLLVTSCSPPESTAPNNQADYDPAVNRAVESMEEEVEETRQAAQEVATESKDAFVRTAEQQLAQMDGQIDDLQQRANVLTADARQDATEVLAEVQAQREAAAEKLGEIKQASGEVWRELQNDLSQTLTKIQRSIEDLKEELG